MASKRLINDKCLPATRHIDVRGAGECQLVELHRNACVPANGPSSSANAPNQGPNSVG